MRDRFDLFWVALEKTALFFSFIATLAILVFMVLIYRAANRVEPAPTITPQHIDPLVDLTCEGFARIQNTVLTTKVSIDHTVPVEFDVRLHPSQAELQLVGRNRLNAGAVTISLRDGAGRLVGQSATMELPPGNVLLVNMDVSERVVIDVPVKVEETIEIPLSGLDLTPLIIELQKANATMQAEVAGTLPDVVDAAGH